MKIARRYVLLQRIVWVQSLLCACLALYVLFARKKAYPLNVTVNETSPLPPYLIEAVTNLTLRAPAASIAPPAPVVGGVEAGGAPVPVKVRFPFRFDRYCVVGGVGCAAVGNRVIREGDVIHGQKVESITPLGVLVDGFFYNYNVQTTPESQS